MDYDVLIIGAGPAGCATAFDLARAGRRVLLVDRRTFPRRKPCAGALTVKAVRALRYSIAPVVREVATDFGIRNRDREADVFPSRWPICALTVRSELDQFCLERTREAGAEFRTIGYLASLCQSDDSVVMTTDRETVQARFVVGADGANSRVRQLAGSDTWFHSGLALEVDCMRPARDVHLEFDFGVTDAGYGWVFPKGEHVNAGIYTSGTGPLTRADLDAFVQRRVGTPAIDGVVGHRVGFGGANYEPGRGRILLTGDAAGLVEPLLGEGIYNAIRSGQAAAAAILTALSRGRDACVEYGKRLRGIRQDLTYSAHIAARFYANVDRAYRALTAPTARRLFMKGYALGLTFTRTRRWAPVLPFVPVVPSRRLMAVMAERAPRASGMTAQL